MAGLSVVGIGKRYGEREVLKDISLHVIQGEIVGLLGPNGAGKTICFYAITGTIAVGAGRILLGTTDATDLPMSARALLGLGYLPQEASIFSGMTVAGNIRAVLELFEHDNAVIDAALARLSASHMINSSMMWSFTGGHVD
jgi:lipopolysaccharide export system ATP-binding protein